jgi:hypothetical protein
VTGVDSGHLAWLLAVDALNLVGGVGALAALGLVRSYAELVVRGGIALLLGVLISGIVEAHLSLIGVPLSLAGVIVINAILAAAGVWIWRRSDRAPDVPLPRRASALLAPVALGLAAIQYAHVAGTAAVRPFVDWDAWAIWGAKAHALETFGTPIPGMFTSHVSLTPHLDYPILQPTLQALALQGGWDPGIARTQMLVLVAGGLWAIVGLCHGRIPLEVPAFAVLFLVLQPWFVARLLTGYADVPVAVTSAVALVAFLRFFADSDRRMLAVGAIAAGGAGLLKNEGSLFVLAAFVAVAVALLAAQRPRELKPLGVALAGTLALWAPWRLYVAVHSLPSTDYKLSAAVHPGYLVDQSDRIWPATRALFFQVDLLYPVLLVLLGLAAALLTRRFALALAMGVWCVLSFAGLVGIFWISIVDVKWQIFTAADRVTTTVLVGAVAAGAVLAGEALREYLLRSTSAAFVPASGRSARDPLAQSAPPVRSPERAGALDR